MASFNKWIGIIISKNNPVEGFENVFLLIDLHQRQSFLIQLLCWVTREALLHPKKKYIILLKHILLTENYSKMITPQMVSLAISTAVRGRTDETSKQLRNIQRQLR